MSGARLRGALIGAAGGAALGAGLLTFLLFAAGDRVVMESGAEVAWAYAGFAGLSAVLGGLLGWLHGAQPIPTTAWEMMKREGAVGLRMGFVFGMLYVTVALGIFLGAGPAMPLWLLALRAGLTLTVSTLLMGAAGFGIGYLKARAAGG